MKRKISTQTILALFFCLIGVLPMAQSQTFLQKEISKSNTAPSRRLSEKTTRRIERLTGTTSKRKSLDSGRISKQITTLLKGKISPNSSKQIVKAITGSTSKNALVAKKLRGENTESRKARLASRSVKPSGLRTSAPLDPLTRLYVNYQAEGTGIGDSWENAFIELADALRYAASTAGVEEIWVAYGIYWPLYNSEFTNDDPLDRNNTFVLLKDVKIYGGFAGTELSLADRDLKKTESFNVFAYNPGDYTTILSGDLADNDYYEENSFEDNALHVVISAGLVGSAVLDGVAIASGNANETSSQVVNTYTIPDNAGGGIAIFNSSPALSNLVIGQNTAIEGSAIYAAASDFSLTNTLVANNYTLETGGIYLLNSSPIITNATITQNISDGNAAGLFVDGTATPPLYPQIRNTILYENDAEENPEISIINGASPTFEFCILKGSGGSGPATWNPAFGVDGGDNLDADPQFYDIENGLFGLPPTSPGVNSGNSAYFQAGPTPDLTSITTDLAGITRINKGEIDRGALESLYDDLSSNLTPNDEGILFVKKGGTGSQTGTDWNNAAAEVADALFAAKLNPAITEIWVAKGTYFPLYRPDDLSKPAIKSQYNSFLLVKGVSLYGGFADDELSIGARDLSKPENATILSGDFNGDDDFDLADFYENGPKPSSAENAYHLLYAVGSRTEDYIPVLDGFTIEGGNTESLYRSFEGNEDQESSFLQDYLLINGANMPMAIGAGIVNLAADLLLSNVVLRNNFGFRGGGIIAVNAVLPMVNTAIYHNFGHEASSGGLTSLGTAMVILNTTITENLCNSMAPFDDNQGAGISNQLGGLFIANSIIYGNQLVGIDDVLNRDLTDWFGSIQIAASIIGGSGGSNSWRFYNFLDIGGNLDEDPAFKDTSINDFSLSSCSRAIDAGINDFFATTEDPDSPPSEPKDLAGNARIYHEFIDMGAFEFQELQAVANTSLAQDGMESSFDFIDNVPHTFAIGSGVCAAPLLTLEPSDLTGKVTSKVWVDSKVNSHNNAVYLQRHFDIDPTENAETATGWVTLYFTQAEFSALNKELPSETEYLPTGDEDGEDDRKANLRIYQFHGPSSDGSGSPSSYGNLRTEIDPFDDYITWNSEMLRWEVYFEVAGFSGFFVGTASQNPLPVRLISFEGKRTDDHRTKLDWKVTEQENIDVYVVEYSENGKVFSEIGRQMANTLTNTDYSYMDALGHSGERAYYRLKIVEIDGKTAYSRLISVKLPANAEITAYPIPAKNDLWIDWKTTDVVFAEFIDTNGRVLKTVKKTDASQKVDISGLPAGVFLLKAGGNNVLKVVKE